MAYGLDMSQVHYETDQVGNRVSAIVPMKVFAMLTSFWHEARRAQTARDERATRPGLYRSSLGALADGAQPSLDTPSGARATGAGGRFDRKWVALLERMPDADEELASYLPARPSTLVLPVSLPNGVPAPNEAAPIPTAHPFVQAWRQSRRWSQRELAKKLSISASSLCRYERNGSRFPARLLPRLARVLDCSIEQLMTLPDSAPPRLSQVESRGTLPAVQAGNDAVLPVAVREHLASGKSPITAWRLYRQLSIADLAEQYGCGKRGIEEMERAATLVKLARLLHCEPHQLVRHVAVSMDDATGS